MSTIRRRYRLLSYREGEASNLLAGNLLTGNIGQTPAEWVARPSIPNNKSYPQGVEKMGITTQGYPQGKELGALALAVAPPPPSSRQRGNQTPGD